jgi:hypothetical protein
MKNSYEDAVIAWNTSATDPLLKEMAEALELAVEIIDRNKVPVGFKGTTIYMAMEKYHEQIDKNK